MRVTSREREREREREGRKRKIERAPSADEQAYFLHFLKNSNQNTLSFHRRFLLVIVRPKITATVSVKGTGEFRLQTVPRSPRTRLGLLSQSHGSLVANLYLSGRVTTWDVATILRRWTLTKREQVTTAPGNSRNNWHLDVICQPRYAPTLHFWFLTPKCHVENTIFFNQTKKKEKGRDFENRIIKREKYKVIKLLTSCLGHRYP